MMMKKLKRILDNFTPVLDKIGRRNVVIGGGYALYLHGLVVRKSDDLDLVIYSPDEEQMKVIKDLVDKHYKDENGNYTDDYPKDMPNSPRRSYKFTVGSSTIDFLLEFDKKTPENLLYFHYNHNLWMVQNVDIIIEAKAQYGRDKDINDLYRLKVDNFNFTLQD